MGSSFPSYEINGGLINLLGIYACSISSENDDHAALFNARLMASIAAPQCLCHSGETDSLSTKSHDLSLDWRDPDWWDTSPWLSSMLTDPSRDSSCFLLRCLPRTSNSRSLTSLCKRSNSWSLLIGWSFLWTLDADWYVCNNPYPEPECSPSHSCLRFSFLLYLLSHQLELWDEPPYLLLT